MSEYPDDYSETISVTPDEDLESLGAYCVVASALALKIVSLRQQIYLYEMDDDTGTRH